ncbi:NAD(P)H-dependent amine dehydrogenase family protein [Pseudofrankia inefficax]|uniref:Dihydrodipicolinate reductase n=1 Tax=Pseudofrankia inefficax (strain DSM 45817 / CECT 9037 / DDB 130130 / EuI1c) TaxID=298654 RepID=E3J522_PSEI1|nr:dihydrodipicolinate reductase [Pseudofrankia inefficax]ADP79473.1 dihydrodipicolinate reductase [Pseudofrankia inefficax]
MGSRLRVVQWTTGKTGTAAVRGMVGHPALEIVGCYAYSPEKVGRDVGELAGIGPIGVTATDDVDALLALRPDCVTYLAYRPDFEHLERILEAGVNVVTTMYMLAGAGYGEEVRDRLAAACERGGASLYTTGVYPGHMGMTALAVSAMCSRIDRISLLESVEMSGYPNERMFRAMSIGLDPADPAAPGMIEANCGSFKEQIRVMAGALAVDLDEIRFTAEFGVANDDLDFGFMKLRKGQIAGFKGVTAGMHRGRSVIECRFVWKLGHDLTPNWPVEDGYVLEIEGSPGVRVQLAPLGGAHFSGAIATAMPAVNAIPHVVAAPPGIVNHTGLPFVTGRHLLTRDQVG